MSTLKKHITQSWPFILGAVLGYCFIILPVVEADFSYFPGDLGDARFNAYILEHAHKFFTGQLDGFWDAPFMYPAPEVITFSDNLLGSAAFYSLFRWGGADVLTAFQYWFVLMLLLNYATCYYFLNWLFKNRYAAVAGAFVFAFSMALQSQLAHAQTFPRFCIPLGIWMTLLFMKEHRPIYFFLSLFFLVWQFYCGIYLGFLLAVPLLFLYAIMIVRQRKELWLKIRKPRWLLSFLWSIALNGLLLMILMLPYYERSEQMGEVGYESVAESIPTIKSFFYSKPGSLFWDPLSAVGSELPAFWDHRIFAGGIATLCMLVIAASWVIRKKRKGLQDLFCVELQVLLLAGFLTFVFFVRIGDHSFYEMLFHIPGFSSMRSLTRIINVELIFYAMAVSFSGLVLFRRFPAFSRPAFVVLLVLLTADNYFLEGRPYRTEKRMATTRVEELKDKLRGIPEGSIISYEPLDKTDAAYAYQLDAMLAAQALNLKTINGYSGSIPTGYYHFWHNMDEASRLAWLEAANFRPGRLYVIQRVKTKNPD